MKTSESQNVKKLEVFDLEAKKSVTLQHISFKIKQFFFSDDDTLFMCSKDSIYVSSSKFDWKPKIKSSFSGKSRVIMDMVDHGENILILLDNGNMVVMHKESGVTKDTIDLPIQGLTPVSMDKHGDNLVIGCTKGMVFAFNVRDLKKAQEMPKPPYLGENAAEPPEVKEYPDSRVVKVYQNSVSVLFADKTMVFYSLGEGNKATKEDVVKSHFGAIYDIDCYPVVKNSFQFCFLTGSTDRTLRRWVVNANPKDFQCKVNEDKIGLLCDNFDHLKNKNQKNEEAEDELGKIRSIKLSKDEDLKHIACGDSCGYLWVFDAVSMGLVSINETHQNEVLGCEFSPIKDFRDKRSQILATCSKDHSVKLFDAKENYEEIKNIQDHDSAVIGIKFIEDVKDPDLKLVSADAKGKVSIRSIDEDLNLTEPNQRAIPRNKIFSITSSETNLILGMEKKLQVGHIAADNSVSLKKSVAPSSTSTREYIKMEADDVSLYCVACSKKKRDISFIEIKSGSVNQTFGCGEVITGVKYSPNYKFLITATSTGCVFIWKVPSNIEREIMFKSNQKELRLTETPKAREKPESKSDGFAAYSNLSKGSPSKEERKAWGNSAKHKPEIEDPRNTMPDWARSTVNVDEPPAEEYFMTTKKTDPWSKLQQTVSGDEGENEEDEEEKPLEGRISALEETKSNKDASETHSEIEDAFDFDKTKVRKTSVQNQDIMLRESRIGNALRNSVFERQKKRMAHSEALKENVTEYKKMKEENKNNTIHETNENEGTSKTKEKTINADNVEKALKHGTTMKKKTSQQSRNQEPPYKRSSTTHEVYNKEKAKKEFNGYNEEEGSPKIRRHSVLQTLDETKRPKPKPSWTNCNMFSTQSQIQDKLRSIVESMHATTQLFNKAAKEGDEISQETKDLMLSFSTGIAAMQFASYNAISNPQQKDSEEEEEGDEKDFLIPEQH